MKQPRIASLRRCVRERLRAKLDAAIVADCRVLLDRELALLPPQARAALQPTLAAREELADRVVAALPLHALVELLSPLVAAEKRALLELAAGVDAGNRERALDVLCGIEHPEPLQHAIRKACGNLLQPAMALMGAGAAAGSATGPERDGTPAANGEATILCALRAGDLDSAVELLAAKSGINSALVRQAADRCDPAPMLALAWRAGCSMRVAMLLQTELAGVSPARALRADPAGHNPVGRGEMAWQLAHLAGD